MRILKLYLSLVILLALGMGLIRLAAIHTDTAEVQAQTSAFEPADCQFEIPHGQRVDCGYLTVPVDHSQPDGPTLRLHVAIFHSHSANPKPDPVIYLEGGPGGHALGLLYLVFNQRFDTVLEEHDLILFDQRGIGTSEPALDCPEYTQFSYDMLDQNLSPEEMAQQSLDVLKTCHDRLVAEGVNFSDYTSAQNAADVAALRIALGYAEWNLYGISYGTRLALTIMRDYPEGLRSVVLDSTYLPKENLYTALPANADRAFNTLFDGCAADPACNAAYPDLKTVFYDLVHQLDENPITIKVTHPLTQKTYDMVINGDALIGFLFQSLYETSVIPSVPQIIYDVRDGRYDTFALLMGSQMIGIDYLSTGMQYAVQCGEEVSFSTSADFQTALQAYPELETFFERSLMDQTLLSVCDVMNVQVAPAVENEPVHSDIPTLVLAGEYDPVTPPEWGQQAAGDLSHSYFFEFLGMGHGVSISDLCPMSMMLAFWDDPTVEPDGSCIQDLTGPAFTLPLGEIKLVPFTNTQFGIEGVAPDGWTDQDGAGVFVAGATGLPAIIQQAAPGITAQMLFDILKSQMQLTEDFSETGTRDANGLSWTLYQLETPGMILDLAMVEGSQMSYMIMLISTADDHDTLYNDVFLPAVDALKPIQP